MTVNWAPPKYSEKYDTVGLLVVDPKMEVYEEIFDIRNTHPNLGVGMMGNLHKSMYSIDFLRFIPSLIEKFRNERLPNITLIKSDIYTNPVHYF